MSDRLTKSEIDAIREASADYLAALRAEGSTATSLIEALEHTVTVCREVEALRTELAKRVKERNEAYADGVRHGSEEAVRAHITGLTAQQLLDIGVAWKGTPVGGDAAEAVRAALLETLDTPKGSP